MQIVEREFMHTYTSVRKIKSSFIYGFFRSFALLTIHASKAIINRWLGKSRISGIGTYHQNLTLSAGFYYVIYLTYLSIFTDVNNSRKSKYKGKHSLKDDGFAELENFDKSFVNYLIKHYLKSKSFTGTLKEYFADEAKKGLVRPMKVSLLKSPDVLQKVLNKSCIIEIVCEHLGLKPEELMVYPYIDTLINLKVGAIETGSDNALAFHRDYDGLRAVRVFFYLNDIVEDDGHHEFIIKSHKKLPLRLRPIRRYSVNDIFSVLPNSNLTKIVGPAGFGWIENTSGLHRGTTPRTGHRIMLTLSFCDAKSVKRLKRDAYGGDRYYDYVSKFY